MTPCLRDMPTQTALVLGASGSVGQALVAELLGSEAFSTVFVFTRRPLGSSLGPKVREVVVPDMSPGPLIAAVTALGQDLAGEAVGFSVLGIGAGTAKVSLEAHRAVDVALNAAFAQGLKASGKVRHMVYMSAMGADIRAKASGSGAAGMPRYARVKGEAEAAVQEQGPEVVSILRPSVILGSQHTPKVLATLAGWLSPLTPAAYRPIRTTDIARTMIALAVRPPQKSAVYCYPEMKALFARGD